MPELNGTTEEIPVHEMREHFEYTRSMLSDIDKDLDCLLEMEKEEEDMGESFDSGALMGMLANKGVDPAVLAMLNDRRSSGDWGDGGLLILLFLIILMGGNGFGGWGNRGAADGFATAGIERSINAASDYNMLMDVLNSNGTRQAAAMDTLAQSFNCSTQQIQAALAGVDKQLAVNQGSIINAVQSVGCQLGNQLSQCCCQTQRAIENQGCATRAEIAENRYNTASQFAAQTALLQSQHCDTINTMNRRFAELELRDMQRELDQKNAQINDLKLQVSQVAQTAEIIAAIRSGTTTTTTS